MYLSPYIVRVIISRRLRWAGHVARMEEGRSIFTILTGKPPGKRPIWKHRHTWEEQVSIQGTGLIRLRIGIIAEPL